MLLKAIISEGREILSALYPEYEAKEMVSAYLEDKFGINRHQHILDPDYSLSGEQTGQAKADFHRMAAGEPLQYVTGKAYFYGREFRVTPDVLIPRQETELLCQSLICRNDEKQTNILDLCTGSGCIAWTLALEMPGVAVTAVDISDGALEVAGSQDFVEEMDRTGAVRPQFVKADVLQGPAGLSDQCPETSVKRKFDIIVSNPPYVMDSEKALMRTNVLDHEPHLALFVPDEDPLKFYRAVALWAVELLAEDGVGLVEINEALGKETADVFVRAGFADVEIVKDLHEKDRFVRFYGRKFVRK